MMNTNFNKLLFPVLVSFFAISISTAMADSDETSSSTHSIASSTACSRPPVHIVYTETPPDEDPKDFHIRTLASALGSEDAAKEALVYSYKTAVSGFSAKLTPDQVSRVSRKTPRQSMRKRMEASLGINAIVPQTRPTTSMPIISMEALTRLNSTQFIRGIAFTAFMFSYSSLSWFLWSDRDNPDPSTAEGYSSTSSYPFDFKGPYESESDETAYLTRAIAQWSGMNDKVPARWHADPRSGIAQGQQHIHMASYEMLMSFQKLSDEVEYHKQNHSRLSYQIELLKRNSVSRGEFDRISSLYAEVFTKLVNSQESLVILQSKHDASIDELREKLLTTEKELQEARAKLSDAKFLAESFEKTEAHHRMEDVCLQYGVTLAMGIVKAKFPDVDYSFVQSEVDAWRDDENRSLDSVGIFASQPLPTAPQHDISHLHVSPRCP